MLSQTQLAGLKNAVFAWGKYGFHFSESYCQDKQMNKVYGCCQ